MGASDRIRWFIGGGGLEGGGGGGGAIRTEKMFIREDVCVGCGGRVGWGVLLAKIGLLGEEQSVSVRHKAISH